MVRCSAAASRTVPLSRWLDPDLGCDMSVTKTGVFADMIGCCVFYNTPSILSRRYTLVSDIHSVTLFYLLSKMYEQVSQHFMPPYG